MADPKKKEPDIQQIEAKLARLIERLIQDAAQGGRTDTLIAEIQQLLGRSGNPSKLVQSALDQVKQAISTTRETTDTVPVAAIATSESLAEIQQQDQQELEELIKVALETPELFVGGLIASVDVLKSGLDLLGEVVDTAADNTKNALESLKQNLTEMLADDQAQEQSPNIVLEPQETKEEERHTQQKGTTIEGVISALNNFTKSCLRTEGCGLSQNAAKAAPAVTEGLSGGELQQSIVNATEQSAVLKQTTDGPERTVGP